MTDETYACYGDVIDAWVLEKRANEDRPDREPKFYASSFGMCHRRMVMERAGVPGRPLTIDSMRNLEERSLLHDARLQQLRSKGALIAADTGTPYIKETVPTRLSDAFPEGFGCRADGIGHLHCGCQRHPFPLSVHWGKMARLWDVPGMEGKAERARRMLVKHRLDVVEIKTAHPNLVNYSASLPRPHNVLQVRAAAWAIRRLYRLEAVPVLIYVPVGSGAKALEYECGGGADDKYEDVEREVATLLHQWDLYNEDQHLPDYKPMMTKSRKEGPNRVLFRVRDWECDELYCPYFGEVCNPPGPEHESGDRLGYEEPDGSVTFVRKWIARLPGYDKLIPSNGQIIEMPRGEHGKAT